MPAQMSLRSAVVTPQQVSAYYMPERGEEAFDMALGPVVVATTEQEWRELRAAMDAAFATLSSQKRQHAELQRLLAAAGKRSAL